MYSIQVLINTICKLDYQSHSEVTSSSHSSKRSCRCDVIYINFDDGIPLCSIHYNEFYRHINLAAPCASCGVLPGGGKNFFRHPPNSTLVNRLLECSKKQPSVRYKQPLLGSRWQDAMQACEDIIKLTKR